MSERTEYWTAHVAAAKQEGISASEYARRHGLAVKTLQYRRRKLNALNKTEASLQAGKFVALHVAPGAAHQNNCSLEQPSGLRLEMSALPSPEWLVAESRVAGMR